MNMYQWNRIKDPGTLQIQTPTKNLTKKSKHTLEKNQHLLKMLLGMLDIKMQKNEVL